MTKKLDDKKYITGYYIMKIEVEDDNGDIDVTFNVLNPDTLESGGTYNIGNIKQFNTIKEAEDFIYENPAVLRAGFKPVSIRILDV